VTYLRRGVVSTAWWFIIDITENIMGGHAGRHQDECPMITMQYDKWRRCGDANKAEKTTVRGMSWERGYGLV